MSSDEEERLRRWRLVLGGEEADGTGVSLSRADLGIDRALGALYDADRKGGLGSSAPNVARWLGDIRGYFPSSVVKVMQQDAMERLDLKRLLLEPEMLQAVEPDVHLVATLLALKSVIPNKTRDTARLVVCRRQPAGHAVYACGRRPGTGRPRLALLRGNRRLRAGVSRHSQLGPDCRRGRRQQQTDGHDEQRDSLGCHVFTSFSLVVPRRPGYLSAETIRQRRFACN